MGQVLQKPISRHKAANLSSTSLSKGAMGCLAAILGAAVSTVPHAASALNLYNGFADGNGVQVNLQTTLSWTPIVRVAHPSATLTGKNAPNLTGNTNGNQGDLDFQHGLVSSQFEALEVLDIKDGPYGAHISGEGYVNTSFLGKNQNEESAATYNPISTPSNRDFTSATRNANGVNARLLDAFVYGNQQFNDGNSLVSLKFGRQTLLWGQSLFFSGNGIAAGMAPIDVVLAQNTPNAQTQQIILPVGQAVLTYQINPTYTLQGYYQFEWAPDYLQGVGSYFSTTDVLDKGGQRLLLAPYFGIGRTKDTRPPVGNGQFGLSLQATYGNYDVGLFGLRYDSKAPALYLSSRFSSYSLVYPRDIYIEGASVSTTVGPVNVAGELSFRQHMNLVTGANPSATNNVNGSPAYPVGDTMAGQVSAIYVSPGIPLDPAGLSIAAEVAFNHLLKVTDNKAALDPNASDPLHRSNTAAQFQGTVTPQYLDVFPHLNVTIPVGIGYDFYGRSKIDSTENNGTGFVNIGVTATYKAVYSASITYNQYIGAANTGLQGESQLADRSYVIGSVQYTF